MTTDKRILEVYMFGWYDEIYSAKHKRTQSEPILIKAYKLGRLDALVGDECEAIDNNTNDEILEQIKKM